MEHNLMYKGYDKKDMPMSLKIEFVEDYLESFLKNDGTFSDTSDLSEKRRTLKLTSGHEVQYVRGITSDGVDLDDIEDFENAYGWQDEIVYVGRELDTNKKCFLGMNYKQSADTKIDLFDSISQETFNQVMFSVMMSRANL